MKNLTIEKSNMLAEIELTYKTKVKAADRIRVMDSKTTFNALKSVYNADVLEHHETFIILLLNRRNDILGWAKISSGGLSGTVVDPKIIFQIALNANASGIIVSHNHPSGDTKPSGADISITKQIKEGGKLFDISILDHLIITEDFYYSFADEGQI